MQKRLQRKAGSRLRNELVSLGITEKIYSKDEKRKIGLGFNINTKDGDTIYLKSGDSMGHPSVICYSRAKNWGIIILLNKRDSKLRQTMLNDIYENVLK